MFRIIFFTLSLMGLSLAQAKSSKTKANVQVLNFDGMNINNSKGSPRDSFSSTKEKADFDYFFKTKISFKKKVIESLEAVR